ncbi:MAG: hypothetical protein ACI86S_001347 [Paracoccaceae bacterium]|jgi:hypothetical protein
MVFIWIAVLLALPLGLHLRGIGAAGLSLSVAAIYGISLGVMLLLIALPPEFSQGLIRRVTLSRASTDGAYHDTRYVLANITGYSVPALLFGSIGLILWVLTRWNALAHQRIAKALFWALHLCVLAMPFVILLITRRMPRRYIDYEEAMALPMAVNSALAGTAALAFLLMVALMLWSIVAKLARA